MLAPALPLLPFALFVLVAGTPQSAPRATASTSPCLAAMSRGTASVAKVEYRAAAAAFADAERLSLADPDLHKRAQLALLGAQILGHDFHGALATYNRADVFAASQHDFLAREALAINAVTVYRLQGNTAGAMAALARVR